MGRHFSILSSKGGKERQGGTGNLDSEVLFMWSASTQKNVYIIFFYINKCLCLNLILEVLQLCSLPAAVNQKRTLKCLQWI